MDQQGGYGALGLIQVGLNHGAACQAVGIGLKVFDIGDQQDHFQQFVDVLALNCAHRHHHGVATPILRHEVVAGEFLLDPIGGGPLLIDLVDGHHDWDLGGPGVADGLQGLGPHTIVGGYD